MKGKPDTDHAGESTLGGIGVPLSRIDGPAKITGGAKYSAEVPVGNVVYGVIVQSTIAHGTIARVDASRAERAPGVLHVMTPANAPRLPEGGKAGFKPPAGRVLSLLQDDSVHYNGQPIAVVIADTLENATHAASLIQVEYDRKEATLDFESSIASAYTYGQKILGRDPPVTTRGNVEAGLEEADVRLDAVYTTPVETHNPIEPHATIAAWEGEHLTLYDSTQFVYGVRRFVAKTLGIGDDKVRVIAKYTGGAFGSKGAAWSHVVLSAMAARQVNRPVKIVLTRRQMFGIVGARPYTHQHLVIGACRDGRLTAIRHVATSSTSCIEEWLEPSTLQTRILYTCPNQETRQQLVRLNLGTPTFNRGPGESSGTFALESAMDELANSLGMDPIALRLANYADKDPEEGHPWSSKSLREAYSVASERFGWAKRSREPRSMRDGDVLVGWGMATATYPTKQMPASASVCIRPDGRVIVRAATHELGTGTYTAMSQVAADTLGVGVDRIEFELGDSELPENPISAGSMTAASTGSAVHAAATALGRKLAEIAILDPASPVHGAPPNDVRAGHGRIALASDASRGESYDALLRRHGSEVEVTSKSTPPEATKKFSMHSFGAVFAEVRVDAELGQIRVSRMTSAYGVGRVLNPKTARSQILGGIVYGIGMALTEHTIIDPRTGRYMNADLGEYHLPVNADAPDIDVIFVDERDPHVNAIGVKGIGEIGTTGVAAAIANAVWHATGIRVRDLPITLDKLL